MVVNLEKNTVFLIEKFDYLVICQQCEKKFKSGFIAIRRFDAGCEPLHEILCRECGMKGIEGDCDELV